MIEVPGRALGPFRLEAVVGAGAMGTVYLARVEGETELAAVGDRVAVKVVRRHLLQRRGASRRFRREAELGRAIRHPNVVRTLGNVRRRPCHGRGGNRKVPARVGAPCPRPRGGRTRPGPGRRALAGDPHPGGRGPGPGVPRVPLRHGP